MWRLFQSARLAFDVITRNLSQATLNTCLDYDNPACAQHGIFEIPNWRAGSGRRVPAGCRAHSEPDRPFSSGSLGYATNITQHGGLEGVLSACGYFVSFTDEFEHPPARGGLSAIRRAIASCRCWFPRKITISTRHPPAQPGFPRIRMRLAPVADNIIALIVRTAGSGSKPAGYHDGLYLRYPAPCRRETLSRIAPINCPPVVQVTMVAVDESAAARPQSAAAIAGALSGKFDNTVSYQADLDDLGSKLTGAKIPYGIFSSAVPIRESKWTK